MLTSRGQVIALHHHINVRNFEILTRIYRPPPETEAEMMLEVFKYTDRVIKMVRPRKILMIAVGQSAFAKVIY